MSLFGNIGTLGAAPTTPQKNNNLFGGGNNSLFGNNQGGGLFGNTQNTGVFGSTSNNLFGNSNTNANNGGGLFNTSITQNANNFSFSNNNNLFSGNNNANNNMLGNSIYNQQQIESSLGFQFKYKDVLEKNINNKFMSIVALPEFDFASFEELRLADYEKAKTGNVNTFRIRRVQKDGNNSGIFGNNKKSKKRWK